MPKIRFAKNLPEIDVPIGANLMQALTNAGIPVASSCGGEAVCGKCVIKVIDGKENLSPMDTNEKDLHDIHNFARNERLSCQSLVLGDITVDADYW